MDLEFQRVGELSAAIVGLLQLDFEPGTPIYIGQSNVEHMQRTHPKEYEKYGKYLSEVIASPDYIRRNFDDGSIEFVKHINGFVKVAVRVSGDGFLFARSLYLIHPHRVENFIKSGELIPLTNL